MSLGEEGAAVNGPVDHEGNTTILETEEHDVEMNTIVGGNEGKLLKMEKTMAPLPTKKATTLDQEWSNFLSWGERGTIHSVEGLETM